MTATHSTLHLSIMVLPVGGGSTGRWAHIAASGYACPGPALGLTHHLHRKFVRVNFAQIEETFTLKKITFDPSLNRVKICLE